MVKLSISFNTSSKKTNIRHNNRELEEEEYKLPAHKHIKRELSKENVVLIKEPIEEVYEKLFGEALKEYNSKQKREDRKIKNYLKHIKKSGTYDYQREFIIAVGDKEYFDNENMKFKKEDFKPILKKLVKEFIKNNPNLYVYNAVIHFDEQGTPHAHVNVVPFAEGYKKGLKVQPSFKKALLNQGYKNSGKYNLKDFCEKQVKSFEEILKGYGIERKIVGTNKIKDIRAYKATMGEIEKIRERELTEIQNKKQELEQTVKEKENYCKSADRIYQKILKINKNNEIVLSNQAEKIDKNKETITQQKTDIAELEQNRGQISTEIENMKFYIEKQKGTYKHNENVLKKQNDTINENKETITQQKTDIAELEQNRGQISTEIENMVEDIEKQKSLIIERVNDEIPKIEIKQNKRYEYVINSYQEKIYFDIRWLESACRNIIYNLEDRGLKYNKTVLGKKVINYEDYENKAKEVVSELEKIMQRMKDKQNEIKEYAEEEMNKGINQAEKVRKESVEKIKGIAAAKTTSIKNSLEDRIAMYEKQEQREIKNKTDKKIEKEKGTSLRL